MAEGDLKDRDLLRATFGLLFFGVPSRGMAIKSLMAMVRGQPNAPFVSILDRNSELLANQHRTFCKAFDFSDSIIVSFFETEASRTAELVSLSQTPMPQGIFTVDFPFRSMEGGK
jgi:protein SERAC1